jgi:hypothetical protein
MKLSKKSHRSLACVDELRYYYIILLLFLDVYLVISKLLSIFVI